MCDTILLSLRNYRPWARTVATVAAGTESPDVTAVLFHVFDEPEIESTRENVDPDATMTMDDLAARKSGILAAREVANDRDIVVEVRGEKHEGEPADGILSVAARENVDRIYTYGRKRSPTGRAVFGSTLQRILLEADVPVVVVPSNVGR